MDGGWRTDRPFDGSTRLGLGKPLPANKRLVRLIGAGTKADPQTAWISGVNEGMTEAQMQAHEKLCKQVAKDHGQSFCVIRGPVHNTQRDIKTGQYVAADNHITIYFGENQYDTRLQGHIYVIADEGVPAGITNPNNLMHFPEHKGEPRSVELYGYEGSAGYDYHKRDRPYTWKQNGNLQFTPASKMSRGKALIVPPKITTAKVLPTISEDGFTEVVSKRAAKGFAPALAPVAETARPRGYVQPRGDMHHRPTNQQENVRPRGNGQPPRTGPGYTSHQQAPARQQPSSKSPNSRKG